MKKLVTVCVFLLLISLSPIKVVKANGSCTSYDQYGWCNNGYSYNNQDNNCNYQSTQARVQPNTTVDWTDNLTVYEGDTINVGSFHNGYDRFVNDTNMRVTGPNYDSGNLSQGQKISLGRAGTYTLWVNTDNNNTNNNCQAQATIRVLPKYQPSYGCFNSSYNQRNYDQPIN